MTTAYAPDAPPDTTKPRRARRGNGKHSKLVLAIAGIVMIGVAIMTVIGFASSYDTLRHMAIEKAGFSPQFARWVPIGIDAGIVVFLGFDLLMAFIGHRFSFLRYTAWALTGVTIYANGASSSNPIGVTMHVAMPILFVVGIEAGRHYIARIAAIEEGREVEPPPLSRWLLAFPSTFKIWRRMKLYSEDRYSVMLAQEQDRVIFKAEMREKYGKDWKKNTDFAHQALLLELSKHAKSIAEVEAMLKAKADAEDKAQREAAEQARREEQQRKDEEEKRAREQREARAEEARQEKIRNAQTDKDLAQIEAEKQSIFLDAQAKAYQVEAQREKTAWETEQERLAFQAEERRKEEERRRVWAAQTEREQATARAQQPAAAPAAPQAPAQQPAPAQAPVPPPAGTGTDQTSQTPDDRAHLKKTRDAAELYAGALIMSLPENLRKDRRHFPENGKQFAARYQVDGRQASAEWAQKRIKRAYELIFTQQDEEFIRQAKARASGEQSEEVRKLAAVS